MIMIMLMIIIIKNYCIANAIVHRRRGFVAPSLLRVFFQLPPAAVDAERFEVPHDVENLFCARQRNIDSILVTDEPDVVIVVAAHAADDDNISFIALERIDGLDSDVMG